MIFRLLKRFFFQIAQLHNFDSLIFAGITFDFVKFTILRTRKFVVKVFSF